MGRAAAGRVHGRGSGPLAPSPGSEEGMPCGRRGRAGGRRRGAGCPDGASRLCACTGLGRQGSGRGERGPERKRAVSVAGSAVLLRPALAGGKLQARPPLLLRTPHNPPAPAGPPGRGPGPSEPWNLNPENRSRGHLNSAARRDPLLRPATGQQVLRRPQTPLHIPVSPQVLTARVRARVSLAPPQSFA